MGNFRSGSQGGFNRGRSSSFARRNFERRDSGERRSFNSRDSFRRDDRGEGRSFIEKFSITCDKCGKKDEVPFKPTQGKPILCKTCFDASKPAPLQEQLDSINAKLDKLIASLGVK